MGNICSLFVLRRHNVVIAQEEYLKSLFLKQFSQILAYSQSLFFFFSNLIFFSLVMSECILLDLDF